MNDSPDIPPKALLMLAETARQAPPLHLWNPPFCGDIDIRIAANGQWFHEGQLIRRPELVRLFSSILRLEADGRFYLVTPAEKMAIQVDDCPFVAVLMEVDGEGEQASLTFVLNTQERIIAGAGHRLWVEQRAGEPHPRLEVRDGLDALLARNVFYQLVDIAEVQSQSGADILVAWSSGECFELGSLT